MVFVACGLWRMNLISGDGGASSSSVVTIVVSPNGYKTLNFIMQFRWLAFYSDIAYYVRVVAQRIVRFIVSLFASIVFSALRAFESCVNIPFGQFGMVFCGHIATDEKWVQVQYGITKWIRANIKTTHPMMRNEHRNTYMPNESTCDVRMQTPSAWWQCEKCIFVVIEATSCFTHTTTTVGRRREEKPNWINSVLTQNLTHKTCERTHRSSVTLGANEKLKIPIQNRN